MGIWSPKQIGKLIIIYPIRPLSPADNRYLGVKTLGKDFSGASWDQKIPKVVVTCEDVSDPSKSLEKVTEGTLLDENSESYPTSESAIMLPNIFGGLEKEYLGIPKVDKKVKASREFEIKSAYDALRMINEDLLKSFGDCELNYRKWIIGTLASNSLSGNPIHKYLQNLKKFGESGNDGSYTSEVARVIDNLDCWERVEKVRVSAGVSYAGRRAEEIVSAGGWGGINSPALLPNFHHYIASISGELFEAHLESYKQIRYIVSTYLDVTHKIGLPEDLRETFVDKLLTKSLNDTWLAVLQEHNIKQLTPWIMKYFLWDERRFIISCTSQKGAYRHQIKPVSKSVPNLGESGIHEITDDLVLNYIFAAKSDQVWLSLFCVEAAGYRPVEAYYPPVPTTTRSVGCTASKFSLEYDSFVIDDKTMAKSSRPSTAGTVQSPDRFGLPKVSDVDKYNICF